MSEKTIQELIQALESHSVEARFKAAFELHKAGEKAAEAVPALVEVLQDDEMLVTRTAALALGSIGEKAVSALIQALKAPGEFARAEAALALGIAGEKAADAVPALLEALKDSSELVQQNAVESLGKIGEKASDAIPALIQELHSTKHEHSKEAESLAKIGVKAVPALIQALEGPDGLARKNAALALGQMGEKAADAIPALTKTLTLNDYYRAVQTAAVEALGKMGEKAIPALVQLLEAPEFGLREKAASALAEIGEKAVPALIPKLGASDEVRYFAADALGKMGEKAAGAVPALIKALEDPERGARNNAAFALAKIGAKAVPALTQVAKQKPKLRQAIQKILHNVRAKDLGIKECLLEAPEEGGRFNRVLATRLMKDRMKPSQVSPKKVMK